MDVDDSLDDDSTDDDYEEIMQQDRDSSEDEDAQGPHEELSTKQRHTSTPSNGMSELFIYYNITRPIGHI